jgi:hypothetical protein
MKAVPRIAVFALALATLNVPSSGLSLNLSAWETGCWAFETTSLTLFQSLPSTQGAMTAQLVGFVYDRDSRPGDQVIASLTTDLKEYKNIPALGVVEMKVSVPAGGTAQASLHGLVVDLGDGRKQPADQPLTIQIAQNATAVPISVSQQGSAASATQASMPLAQGSPPAAASSTGKASDFTTPPVVQNVSFISGPLSGNGGITSITVDHQPAAIVAGTPRSVFFNLPAGTTPGQHTLTLQDGQRSASAPIVKIGLVMKADQLKLQRGQSTNYSATVQLGPLPDSAWQHGGSSPELVNQSEAANLAPGFRPPAVGEPAVVFLHLANASRQTVTIRPSQNETITRVLHQQDFQNNQFTQAGVIQSIKSGGFDINAVVQAFFAPIGCEEPVQTAAQATPPVLLAPPGGAFLAIKATGRGGDGLEKNYERAFADKDLQICETKACGDPQEIKEGKNKGLIYCKEDNKCGGKKCPNASCHVFWAWIDGAKGPGGKDHKDDNEKWSQFGQDTKGTGSGSGIGKDNAIPNDKDHAYACVCK